MRTRTAPRPWTAEEEALLREHVAKHGPVKWNIMASALEGRSHYECRNYWTRHLDPTLTKGPWTAEEDGKLIELCKKHGRSWKIISDMMPGRADIHCRSRFLYALDTSVRKDPWTIEEDAALSSLYEKHGKRWVTIADQMPGRTDAQCCGRMNTLIRRKRSGTKRDVPSSNEQNIIWTPEQDAALQDLQDKFGNAWTKIAASIPGQTKYSCQRRWHLSAENPDWTVEEDVALLSLRHRHGNEWAKIASAIPGRTELQCHARWTTTDKQMRAYGWTASEDATLVMLYARYGSSWSEIAEKMARRTSVQCRLRCASCGVTPVPDFTSIRNTDRATENEADILSQDVTTSQTAPCKTPSTKKSNEVNVQTACNTFREESIAEKDEPVSKFSQSRETGEGKCNPNDAARALHAIEVGKSDSSALGANMTTLTVPYSGIVAPGTEAGNEMEDIDFSSENAIERVLENAQRLQDQLDELQKQCDGTSFFPSRIDIAVDHKSNKANSQFIKQTSKRSRPYTHEEEVPLSSITTFGVECTVDNCQKDGTLEEGDYSTSANEKVNGSNPSSECKRQRRIGSITGEITSSPKLDS